jgi:hypothetical protein
MRAVRTREAPTSPRAAPTAVTRICSHLGPIPSDAPLMTTISTVGVFSKTGTAPPLPTCALTLARTAVLHCCLQAVPHIRFNNILGLMSRCEYREVHCYLTTSFSLSFPSCDYVASTFGDPKNTTSTQLPPPSSISYKPWQSNQTSQPNPPRHSPRTFHHALPPRARPPSKTATAPTCAPAGISPWHPSTRTIAPTSARFSVAWP